MCRTETHKHQPTTTKQDHLGAESFRVSRVGLSRSLPSALEWKLRLPSCGATHAKRYYFSFGKAMFIYTRETGYSPDYGLIIGTLVHSGSACSFDGVARPAIGQSYQGSTTCELSNESWYTRSRTARSVLTGLVLGWEWEELAQLGRYCSDKSGR